MSVLIFVVALVAAVSAFDNRDGRTGQLRVVNMIGNFDLSSFREEPLLADNLHSFADGAFPEFNNAQTLNVYIDYDDVQAEVDSYPTGAVASQAGDYKVVNLEGGSKTVNITLGNTRQGAADNQNVEVEICGSITMSPDRRTTIFVVASTSVAEDVDAGNCITDDNNDNCAFEDDVVTPAEIDFECFKFEETIAEETCSTFDPVNIHRFDPLTCDQFIVRTSRADDSTVSDDEIVQVAEKLDASPTNGDPDDRSLDTGKTYTIKDNAVFAELPARVHDFFWGGDGGPVFVVDSLTTGRVGLLNAAYRTNGDNMNLQLDSDFRFTISTTTNCENFVTGGCIVHSGDLDVLEQTELIELETGSYTLRIYSEDATDLEIFGDVETGTNPTADDITSETFTVTNGGTTLFVLDGGNSDDSTSLSIITVPVTSDVTEDTTDHTIFNLVNENLKFAQPSGDCCNFLSSNVLSDNEEQTFNTDDVSGTFDAYAGDAECGSLTSSLLDADVFTLENDIEDGECGGRKVHFLIGRSIDVDVAVNADQGTCTIEDCNNVETRITRINEAGGDDNDGIVVRTFTIPQCTCDDAEKVKCEDVCEADEFNELAAKLDAVSAAVARVDGKVDLVGGNVLGTAAAQDRAFDKIDKDFKDVESKIDDAEDNIESEIDDVGDDIKSEVKKQND